MNITAVQCSLQYIKVFIATALASSLQYSNCTVEDLLNIMHNNATTAFRILSVNTRIVIIIGISHLTGSRVHFVQANCKIFPSSNENIFV